MDPQTAYVIAALMMLANGGVLGLMHRDLPKSLRPGAVSWRIATLLIAGASILFALQAALPPAFILPLANGMVLLGFVGYWRAIRQFYGMADSWWLLLPVAAGSLGVFLFTALWPSLLLRILLISVLWLVIFTACVLTLHSQASRDRALSRRVLTGMFLGDIVFTFLRAAYFLLAGVSPGASLLNNAVWINVMTPMMVAVLPVIGTTAFLLMISERIRRQWERAASTDYLTGLANRRTMTDAGESRFSSSRASGSGLALAIIDIDHFKSVNDRFGHEVGDGALKHVASRLEAACRGKELPARQGGEEFVVLLDIVDENQAHAAGERLRQAVEAESFAASDVSLNLTVSIGVAVLKKEDLNFDNLLRRADEALYAAKAGGRNRVALAA